jgi:hypothetical protein
MKRFLLFAGEIYYASGGFHDLIGSFDSLEEAVSDAENDAPEVSGFRQWWHVFDLDARKVVAQSEKKPHGAELDLTSL